MLAIDHKSWSLSATETSALRVLIRDPGAFQIGLYDGTAGCRRPHLENNVLCNTRPYDQLEYVVVVVICS
jgi:hypothetical protein